MGKSECRDMVDIKRATTLNYAHTMAFPSALIVVADGSESRSSKCELSSNKTRINCSPEMCYVSKDCWRSSILSDSSAEH
eukprot:765017-Pelagomonas_calceolata.AAC.2